ncbi:hypothetical protein [Jannaschia sp. CCS1]|uniref:hypothetical protein n=1 Tax=Jannaschia sp. (strain CCS1) TaxID=290400 RepID=UPI00006C0007|nr:hypothetical protein [Jannaschia sp. CCS1]ABD54660.1 hypothetical protein Jann_1743 [Jannaschia sp. CCS1]
MMLYEWRVSLLDGGQSVRLSGQGIWIGDDVFPWSRLTDVSFVRYQTRGGLSEDLSLSFGPDVKRKLRWTGPGRKRGPWRAMLMAFADQAARARPDLRLRDGPDAQEQRTARWIGLGVAGVAVGIMGVVFASGPSIWGALAGGWIGLTGGSIGAITYMHYARVEEPPRLDWISFAAREGQPGELPAN